MRASLRPARGVLLLAVLLVLPPPGAAAHEVEMLDGTLHEGEIVREDDEVVVIETTFDGRKELPRSAVKRLDRSVPPLRSQLDYRRERAGDDARELLEVSAWAREHGFEAEAVALLERVLEVDPRNVRARRLLGHEKVDGVWMSPEEKARHLAEQEAEAMRAQGLVPYEGRWVTPEEKEALEKGLVRDGDEWVTEEEYHRRRGEVLRDGAWVRLGEAEGKAWGETAAQGARARLSYVWGPHFDVYHDVNAELAGQVLEAAEQAYARTRRLLVAEEAAWPQTVAERIKIMLFEKLPAYARFTQHFDEIERASELVPGWQRAVQRQHSFWWADPTILAAVYQFPNTDRTFISNAVHAVGLLLITRYRFNYRFPHVWLREGFAYWLELEVLGYSESFSLGRGGTGAAAGNRPAWADSDQWRPALRKLVLEGADPPFRRLAIMETDGMGYVELVKSWSVVEYLIARDPERFKAFIDGIKDRDKTEEEALRQAYGEDYRGIDRGWRQYVNAGFEVP